MTGAARSPSRHLAMLLAAGVAAGGCGKRTGADAPGPGATTSGLGWRVGDRRSYTLDLTSDARVGSEPVTQFRLQARVALTALEASPARVLVHAELRDAKLGTDLAPLRAEYAALESKLAPAFLFDLGPGGAVQSYYFTDDPSGLIIGIRQSLGAAMRVERRAGAGASWVVEEQDATGRYEAEYKPGAQPNVLGKRKLRYLSLSGAPLTPVAQQVDLLPRVDQSETRIELGDDGVINAVNSEERVRSGGGAMMPLESTTRLALRAAGVERVAADKLPSPAALLQAARRYELGKPWRPSRESPKLDEARIAGRSLDDVVAAAREMRAAPAPADKPAQEARERRRADLYVALEALIRSRPATVTTLLARIRSGDELASLFIDALGSSGAPAGQKALADLLREQKLPGDQLRFAAIALSRTPRPTEAATAGLAALLDTRGLRVQAMYGLGTAVRRLREAGDERRAKQTLDIILGRLRNAKGSELVTALRAIANSGHEDAFPLVEPHLKADDDEVRAAAVESLQLIKLDRADAEIARALVDDKSHRVRLAAGRAARLRQPTPALEAAVAKTARDDANPNVRLGALRVLTAWLHVQPSLRAVVEQIAEQETQQAIRAEARAALVVKPTSG